MDKNQKCVVQTEYSTGQARGKMVKTESGTRRTGLSEVCPIGGSAVAGVPRGRGKRWLLGPEGRLEEAAEG